MHRLFAYIFSLVLLLSPNFAWADQKAAKQKELTQLKSRIEKLRKTIEVKENSKSSYNRQLRSVEKKIGAISKKIRSTRGDIRKQKKQLNSLQTQKRKIERDIRSHQTQLANQIRSAYTMGQQEQIKLLFSQQNAATFQRNLTYYEYFSRHRLELIESAQSSFDQLIQNEKAISTEKQKLETALAQQNRQKNNLKTDQRKRKSIISNLNRELRKQGTHLSQLEVNANNLTKLIESLNEILIDIPAPVEKKKFVKLRGKLAWPVKGKVKKLFGKTKPPSNLRWQGVMIQAPDGNNVRAVSHGRVAFSDWLRGMGNLIIIDHGDGYLSLYGHNQSLFKSAGEWVEAGDIIGSIGNSGGQKSSGLYFEIRKKGKPQNPTRWCHSKNWSAT